MEIKSQTVTIVSIKTHPYRTKWGRTEVLTTFTDENGIEYKFFGSVDGGAFIRRGRTLTVSYQETEGYYKNETDRLVDSVVPVGCHPVHVKAMIEALRSIRSALAKLGVQES